MVCQWILSIHSGTTQNETEKYNRFDVEKLDVSRICCVNIISSVTASTLKCVIGTTLYYQGMVS